MRQRDETGRHRVIASLEDEGGARCVDIFVRADGSHGFEIYRRDGEDPRGWYPTGHHTDRRFTSAAAARRAAAAVAPWVASG